jgi:serine/threonine protein kinase
VLDDVTAASVIVQAARGLAYAHDKGLVHRDVKPGNLLVTTDGRVKVLDLGLAGSIMEEESTRLGRVIGTMDYMAPEQIRAADKAGPPADVYGLGCTLYYALVGEVPFPGGTREEKARRHLCEPPPPIRRFAPQASAALCAVVEAMMQKDPADRLASAAAVIDRLRPWTPDGPMAMPRQPVPGRTGPGPETVLAGKLQAASSHASSESNKSNESGPGPRFDPLSVDGPGGAGRDDRAGGLLGHLLAGIRRVMLP